MILAWRTKYFSRISFQRDFIQLEERGEIERTSAPRSAGPNCWGHKTGRSVHVGEGTRAEEALPVPVEEAA